MHLLYLILILRIFFKSLNNLSLTLKTLYPSSLQHRALEAEMPPRLEDAQSKIFLKVMLASLGLGVNTSKQEVRKLPI